MYIADRRQIDRHLVLCSQKLNLSLGCIVGYLFYDTLLSEISVQVSSTRNVTKVITQGYSVTQLYFNPSGSF